jgi:hypothetical protein
MTTTDAPSGVRPGLVPPIESTWSYNRVLSLIDRVLNSRARIAGKIQKKHQHNKKP